MRSVIAELIGPAGPLTRFSAEVAERPAEFEALTELLLRHAPREGAPTETRAVARAIAAGCLGDQHLWRDMRLPDRAALRELLETYFASLAAINDRDMRWKKFLYKCLCRWEGFGTCRAPSCGECSSYEECFGPEV